MTMTAQRVRTLGLLPMPRKKTNDMDHGTYTIHTYKRRRHQETRFGTVPSLTYGHSDHRHETRKSVGATDTTPQS
jgi:hypothetical protein